MFDILFARLWDSFLQFKARSAAAAAGRARRPDHSVHALRSRRLSLYLWRSLSLSPSLSRSLSLCLSVCLSLSLSLCVATAATSIQATSAPAIQVVGGVEGHRRVLDAPLVWLTPDPGPSHQLPRARRGSPGDDGLAPRPPGPHQRLVFSMAPAAPPLKPRC